MLLDTDVLVDILRQHPPALAWLSAGGSQAAALPGLSAMEVLQGCQNLADLQRAERLLRRFSLQWPTAADCQRAYNDFAAYRLSHGVDLLDMLIGHTAVGLNEPLATFNVKHYRVIAGLQTIQPY